MTVNEYTWGVLAELKGMHDYYSGRRMSDVDAAYFDKLAAEMETVLSARDLHGETKAVVEQPCLFLGDQARTLICDDTPADWNRLYHAATPEEQRQVIRHYVRSLTWRRFAAEVKKERGNRCEFCGAHNGLWKRLDVHHKPGTYIRIGYERRDDVLALCCCCHSKRHRRVCTKHPERIAA